MIYTRNDLLNLIHTTKALSIWNREKGPVFWYIAGVPGPFYVNTELLIGKDCAEKLLEDITAILASTSDPKARAQAVEKAVMAAYASNDTYKKIIATMVARSKENTASTYGFVSGGERRDWLFSIPFAKALGLKHLYLFKDQSLFCEQKLQHGETGIHVSDLINNAASYFNSWLPALEKAHLTCAATICVISRNAGALKKLDDAGVKVIALNSINLGFFEQSAAASIISKETLDEISLHFRSPKEWAVTYLMDHPALFATRTIDKKSFERLQSFFATDPWSLRSSHEKFFADMRGEITARLGKAA
jgi:orotate phosphoribosyltransferase